MYVASKTIAYGLVDAFAKDEEVELEDEWRVSVTITVRRRAEDGTLLGDGLN